MSKSEILILVSALSALTVACTGPGGDPGVEQATLRIVCTTGMVADTAARIAGPRGEVTALMGPGVDPHLFKASESDVRRLAEADLILYSGLQLEGKMADILVKMARGRPVVAVSESVPEQELREPPGFAGHYDPHIWFDVRLWAQTLEAVVTALSEVDPANAAEYRERAGRFADELLELDGWVASRIDEIPPGQRILVTAHDAFGYFGRRYGMQVVGLQGISTLAEAGLRDVDRVVDAVVDSGIKAVFIESSVPRRAIEAVQAACRERGHEVVIGGELHSDALGAAGTPAGTYPGMVRSNVNTIVEALR